MRHRKKLKKLSMPSEQRKALLRSLASALIKHRRIKTTKLRAKETASFVSNLLCLAKKNDLLAKRKALAILPNKEIINILFKDLVSKLSARTSGFTRLVPLGLRRGDAAKLVYLELVD
jgi:large subunit ribosomal protein L17